jgi:hypothetical protein
MRLGSIEGQELMWWLTYRSSGKASGVVLIEAPSLDHAPKELADSIDRMLVSDNTSVKFSEMEKALPHVTMEEDHATLRRIDFALAEHGETTAKWRNRLLPGRPVVPLKLLKKADGSLR